MGICKARLLRLLSNFRLFKAADRQQQVRELLLRELIEQLWSFARLSPRSSR